MSNPGGLEQGSPERLKGRSSGDCGFTHGLLGQRVLEAAAQGLLGGWSRMRGLGVRQQVLGGGWALGVGPFDAVHLDGGLGRVVDAHVHHRRWGLHWGAGHSGFRAAPQGWLAVWRSSRAGFRPGPATLLPARLGLPGSARCLVPSAEICPGPRGTRKAACWAGGPSPGPGGSAITWTA